MLPPIFWGCILNSSTCFDFNWNVVNREFNHEFF